MIVPDICKIFNEKGVIIVPQMDIDSNMLPPCITYMPMDNSDIAVGDNVGYSEVSYQFQVWNRKYSELIKSSEKVDKIMKQLKFVRISAPEQCIDGLFRKILTYRRIVKESI